MPRCLIGQVHASPKAYTLHLRRKGVKEVMQFLHDEQCPKLSSFQEYPCELLRPRYATTAWLRPSEPAQAALSPMSVVAIRLLR